jgi:hypothetical protein|tara:strand:- start:808 stop:978 length:171 start_codon:yes stop_codon:yes gene_type:complete
MKDKAQDKYVKTEKGKDALTRAQEKYDSKDPEKRKQQKREYMRRKRREDPSYGKWK